MTEDERLGIIETALSTEFPTIWEWTPTEVAQPFGPDDQDRVASFYEAVSQMRADCIAALRELPEDELRKIQTFSRSQTEISTWPWAARLPRSLNVLARKIPPNIAYGFGHPSFSPDFDHWVLMPELSVIEATLLSVGADPRYMSSDDLYKMKKKEPEKLWSALQFLIGRYDLLFRVFPSASMRKLPMRTKRLHEWFLEAELDIHPDFRAALHRRFDGKAATNIPKEALETEKASMLKLVAGMAIKGYRYDPHEQRSTTVQEIADDLDRLGISLDLKTIRKWLKESCKLVAPENLDK